jgi:predicted negative regulator of RcsB-dependent stress response
MLAEVVQDAEASGDPVVQGFGRAHLGRLHRDRGEYQQALDHYARSVAVAHPYRLARASHRAAYASVQLAVGDLAAASVTAQRAMAEVRGSGDVNTESVVVQVMARVHAERGEVDQAIALLSRNVALCRRKGHALLEVDGLVALGRAEAARGRRSVARRHQQDALERSRAHDYSSGEAAALAALCALDDAEGISGGACADALESAQKIGYAPVALLSRYYLARAARRRGELAVAREQLEEALTVVDAQRLDLRRSDLRQTFSATVDDIEDEYVDLLADLAAADPAGGWDVRAFEASERSRGDPCATSSRNRGSASGRAPIPRCCGRRTRCVTACARRSPAAARGRLGRGRPGAGADDRRAAGEPRRRRGAHPAGQPAVRIAEPARATEPGRDPHGPARRRHRPPVLRARRTAELPLGGDGDDARATRPAVAPRDRAGRASSGRRAVRARAVVPWPGDSRPHAARAGGRAARRVARRRRGRRRAALRALRGAPLPRTQEPLLRRSQVVNLPSASAGVMLAAVPERAGAAEVAVFADPVFRADDPRVQGRSQAPSTGKMASLPRELTRDGRLERLPFTRQEARAIQALAGSAGRVALDFDASREAALGERLSSYRVVHFATHGLLNASRPELSGIVLSLVDSNGRPQDGFLTALDTFNLRLDADLVVLSGCRTALGKDVRSEGIVGLTRGFMYAGARGVLATLWPVDDLATSELMRVFYEGLLGPRRLSPPAALREAQAHVRSRRAWSSPYYWAAFQLQGVWARRPGTTKLSRGSSPRRWPQEASWKGGVAPAQ